MATDWQKIKLYYLHNNITLCGLAEKFDVGRSAVFHHSAKERWTEAKRNFNSRVTELVNGRAAEKQAETFLRLQEELESGIAAGGRLLLGKLMETLNYGEAFSPRDLKNLSGTLLDLHQEYRNAKADAGGGGESVQVIEWVNGEWDETDREPAEDGGEEEER